MNNSEEVKDIAIIYKLKRNYGTLEYVGILIQSRADADIRSAV